MSNRKRNQTLTIRVTAAEKDAIVRNATKARIFDEIQNDIHSTAYRRRHRYIEGEVMVEGMTYKVISVLPFSDGDYCPETVQDKLEYLINGKKS